MLNRVAVVVPAHNEQAVLPRCLAALRVAVRNLPPAEVIVVADSCHDATASIAARAGAHVITTDARNVGRARHAGMQHALRHGVDGLWLATTDADSHVPADWLDWHRHHAEAGADILTGTVTVADWRPRPQAVRSHYETLYRRGVAGTAHHHVHGANLGCSATAYQALGGFAPLPHSEDHDLVDRARQANLTVVADATCPVTTSARRRNRAPHGFATYLDELGV